MKVSVFRSISARLIINIGLILLTICTCLTFFSSYKSSQALEKNLNESLLKITQQASQTVSARFEEHYGSLIALSTNDLFLDINTNKAQILHVIKEYANIEGHYDVVVSDASGMGYSMNADELDISAHDYFKSSVSGINNVSDPLDDDTKVIIFSVPIKDHSGKIIGTLSAVRGAEELTQMVSEIKYVDDKDSYAFIINKTGYMVAHYNFDHVKNNVNFIEKNDPKMSELIAILKKMTNRESDVGAYEYEGLTKYLGYTPIEGTSWSMGLTAPEELVFEGVTQLRTFIILISAGFIIIGIFLAVLIANGFKKSIKAAANYASTLAKGDFSVEVPYKFIKRKDELGVLATAFKTLIDNMNELMANIRTASEQVASGAKQISESSIELSQGATEQASSIEELTASIEEIASQTRLNAENATNANTYAVAAQKYATVGNDQMKLMLKSMEDINVSSSSISKIIKVIDDIAFQTNILALNAAVEAARAGQHGKGFAVVAEEVRNLAARSANAAKETTDLIEGSINKVNGGTKIAGETAEELKKIVEGISKVAELVNNIANASNEQASGIAQINQGIMQVSQVVQENSATSEEAAAASEELSGQSVVLEEQISKFILKDSHTKINSSSSQIKHLSNNSKVKSKPEYKEIKISLSDKEFGKY